MKRRETIPGFRDALLWLDEHYGYFLTPILNMGYPEVDEKCDTAYVTLNPQAAEGFSFRINPDFASRCETSELAGVLAHETMHVLLKHMTLSQKFPNAHKFNMAADLIINDYLTDAGFDLPDGVLRGLSVVGFDCALSDIADVYHAIKDDPSKDGEDSEGGKGSEGEGADGSDSGEICGFAERISEAVKAAAAAGYDVDKILKDLGAGAAKAVGDKMPQDLEQSVDSAKPSLGAGSGFNSVEEYARQAGTSLNWVKLLAEVNPDILRKPGREKTPERISYHAPRRKIAAHYPSIILPNSRPVHSEGRKSREGAKPAIVLALDTSGSIPREMVQKMTSLAASVPSDLIEVHCCTFSTHYVPFDHTSTSNRIAGGGTDFSAVESFIREKVLAQMKTVKGEGRYPQAVIVITDGEANFRYVKPSSEQLGNWTWLMIPGSGGRYYRYHQELEHLSGAGRVKDLSAFI